MPYTLVMLRRGDAHAVKVKTSTDEVLFMSSWSGRPEDAVAEARAWMQQHARREIAGSPSET